MIFIKSYIYQEIDKKDLKKGTLVDIIIGEGTIKRGRIKELKSKTTPKDKMHKVELTNGLIGKVIKIVSKDEVELENFKFFNILFYSKEVYSIYNCEQRNYTTINKKDSELQHILIFTGKEEASDMINKSKEKFNNCKVNKLHPNKRISENFKKVNKIDYVIINNTKKVSFSKFKELENQFLKK